MSRLGRFRVTFDRVTLESSVDGDVAESGFINAAGDTVAAIIGRETPGTYMTLREAFGLILLPLDDSGHWFTEAECRCDHSGNGWTRRELHPPRNVTGASYGRLARLLERQSC